MKTQQKTAWDTLIRGALVFDGSGDLPAVEDLAISQGTIAARGQGLDANNAREVVNAQGKWLMPGLLDIHTHLDLEVEVNPGLGEAVRHGTTTAVVGNCSLGTAFGAQNKKGDNPVVDCFARVENIPKPVLQKCVDKMTWDNTADYLEHFKHIPLGPNIAPFIPHSMLRVEVMGVNDSVQREPNKEEVEKMKALLEQALQQGYIGLSTDQIVFHYLSMDPNKNKRIPTQFAQDSELKQMLNLVRQYGRVWQTNPDSDKMGRTLKRFFWSSGRLFGKPLKITALTALDFLPTPGMWKYMLKLCRLINSKLLKGNMNFQALGTNFRMWADGVVAPIFEELDSTRALISCELDDREARLKLLNDSKWQQQFAADWETIFIADDLDYGAKVKSKNKNASRTTFKLKFCDMYFSDCAVPCWNDDSFREVYQRLQKWQESGGKDGAKSTEEAEAFAKLPQINSELEFFLEGLKAYDLKFRWWFDSANINPDTVREILFHPDALPGFNDSGAHLNNMAFYDANLITLKLAAQHSEALLAKAVRRLTKEPAEFFSLSVGGIEPGDQADIVIIDPDMLLQHDTNAKRTTVFHEQFDSQVMVNRSDGVVEQVYIRGVRVWEEGCKYTPALGSQTLGRVLTADDELSQAQSAA